MIIKDHTSAALFQKDIDALNDWCSRKRLELNIGKCKVISFTRKTTPILLRYTLGVHELQRVFDLGVNLDPKLSFTRHIEITTAKAYAMLGFVKRICSNMANPYALKSVFCAFVRSKLEYANVLNPYYNFGSTKIETIQKQFFIYALRRLYWNRESYALPPYDERCKSIGLESLERRRYNTCVCFIYDLLEGHIDTPALVSMLDLNENTRVTRTA